MNDGRPPLSVDRLDAAVDLMGRSGRGAILPMKGESMLPTLRPGQLVAVDLAPSGFDLGDLMLFRQVDYLVVHRFLGPASREDGMPRFRSRGDGSLGLDAPVDRARVLGKVVAIEERGQWWSLESGGARLWAIAMALHDLCWAAAGVAAGDIERRLRRLGLRIGLQAWVARVDRFLLGVAHRSLFGRMHRRSARPPAGFHGPSGTTDVER